MPAWLVSLHARASQPPARRRVPLLARQVVIGSVEPAFLDPLAGVRLVDGTPAVTRVAGGSDSPWQVQGELTATLNLLAHEMRQKDMCSAWRNEQLSVRDPHGQVLGTVERAAVRPLGISTHAVHLVGFSADGRMWVQQRALDKPNDPGMWDTLMGGMVPASDSLAQALERETWEEAGLRIAAMQDVQRCGRITLRRPSDADGAGPGYTVEDIDWFRCIVPDGMGPENQDGEVAQFRLVQPAGVLADVERGEYTLEAALIIAAALGVDKVSG
jgi:isopentenyldiphosphate isomerase